MRLLLIPAAALALLLCAPIAPASATMLVATRALQTDPGLAAAAFTPVAVIGEDDRAPVDGGAAVASRGVGFILESGSAYTCTAFCVADTVIATSAHCILRRDQDLDPVNLSQIRFHIFDDGTAAEPGNQATATRTLRAATNLQPGFSDQPATAVYHGQFSTNRNSPRHFDDWALAKLDRPLCEGRVLKIGKSNSKQLRQEEVRSKVYMVGYHGGRFEEGRIRSSDCELRKVRIGQFMRTQQKRFASAPDLLLHRCDMEQGASGAPIFHQTEDGPEVVAMNSGSISHLIYQVRPDTRRRQLISRYDANTAVLSRAFADGIARFQDEALLSSEGQFRRLQELLKAKGYYQGPIDAIYGPGTRSGIFQFEDERGWVRTGVPTLQLLVALEEQIGGQMLSVPGGAVSVGVPPGDDE